MRTFGWSGIEITASVVMAGIEDSIRKPAILRGLGVTVTMDDVGTGYSSPNRITSPSAPERDAGCLGASVRRRTELYVLE